MAAGEEGPLARLRRLETEQAQQRREAARSATPARGATPAPGKPAATPKRPSGPLGRIFGAIAVVLIASKGLLVLLASKGGALLGALKFGKLATTLSTMGVSAWAYAQLYGWKFGVGLVALILVHELGHGFAAKYLGLRVGPPIFIPGFGAVIALKDQPRSTWVHAVVGYGGPLLGSIGGVAVLAYGALQTDADVAGFTRALANFAFLINLFNLVPVGGLDGDRISEPLRPNQWWPCLALTALVTACSVALRDDTSDRPHTQVLFGLAIVAFGAIKVVRLKRRERTRAAGETERVVDRLTAKPGYVDEDAVTPVQRRVAMIAYVGLIAALMGLIAVTDASGP